MKRVLLMILVAALLLSLTGGALAAGSYALVSNTSRLNIRSGPGMEFPIIGSVSRGEWVEIHNNAGSWIQGRVMPSGASIGTGWLKPRENSRSLPLSATR